MVNRIGLVVGLSTRTPVRQAPLTFANPLKSTKGMPRSLSRSHSEELSPSRRIWFTTAAARSLSLGHHQRVFNGTANTSPGSGVLERALNFHCDDCHVLSNEDQACSQFNDPQFQQISHLYLTEGEGPVRNDATERQWSGWMSKAEVDYLQYR